MNEELETTFAQMVAHLFKPGEDIISSLNPLRVEVWHMASCLPGEAGELFDAVKKWCIYNKPLDRDNVIEELGDMEFYMEGLRMVLDISREETLKANISKLSKRYSNGSYSDQQAQDRADKAEEAVAINSLGMLQDLLCVIHRDGGHRIADIGLSAATAEAMQRISQMWAQTDDNGQVALEDMATQQTYGT